MGMDRRLEEKDWVVSDVGNVLISFDRDALARRLLPPRLRPLVWEDGFRRIWRSMDAGEASAREGAALICREFGLQGDEGTLENYITNLDTASSRLPFCDTLAALRARGKKVYLLTNYIKETFAVARRVHHLDDLCDGYVMSADVGVCKPDPRIYQILIDRFAIDPARAVFIDDMPENVDAARKFGFSTILFPGGLEGTLH